ncbi:MAG: indole-3-glycerol phosphate synthase TrpC [Terrimicrobiaceae bacterium]
MTILDQILGDVREEVAASRLARPLADLRSRIADAPPVNDFHAALAKPAFCLIAEIKERSPSVGPMRPQNVADAAIIYEECPLVEAISVLTNATHFGMSVGRLEKIRTRVSKPVLRKDFLIDEYQVREARAFGADAVLLMANVLDSARLAGFYDLARELGMEALFEVHEEAEIAQLPPDARIVGINSRKFKTQTGFVAAGQASKKDFSVDFSAFDLAEKLPNGVIRVAESGLTPASVREVSSVFHAGLVGTSLLRDERGVAACLKEFAAVLSD